MQDDTASSRGRALGKEAPRGLIDLKGPAIHFFRVILFLFVLVLIREQHADYVAARVAAKASPFAIDQVRAFYPDAVSMGGGEPKRGGWTVHDGEGSPIGYVAQTSPRSDEIIGYSGPTNTLIAFDTDSRVLGIAVLESGDTPDHVREVLADDTFMYVFDGLRWEEIAAGIEVDGVSGSTLTSLAIAEGVVYRLGGQKPSYRFPDPVSLEEVKPFLPNVVRLKEKPGAYPSHLALDEAENKIGVVARTSPAADALVGYRGPTDVLAVFDADDRLKAMTVRKSYESPEYLGYVQEDDYFLNRFQGMHLNELATLDLEEAQVEGVSGATMTSLSMAEGLVRMANRLRAPPPPQKALEAVWRLRDAGTVGVVVLALLFAFTRLRGNRMLRIAFQIVLIAYLGLVNGDMLSQALLVGWAQHGLAWRFAPGLIALSAAAFLIPVTTRRQLYCHHICPHGAAQQLLKRRLPWTFIPPRWLSRLLRAIPLLLLAWVLAVAMPHLPFDLTGIEPFDAYMIRAAGWATIIVAIVGLAASLVVPMAYCRYGCPTGALLNYLRYNTRSGEFTRRDAAAVFLFLLTVMLRLI